MELAATGGPCLTRLALVALWRKFVNLRGCDFSELEISHFENISDYLCFHICLSHFQERAMSPDWLESSQREWFKMFERVPKYVFDCLS